VATISNAARMQPGFPVPEKADPVRVRVNGLIENHAFRWELVFAVLAIAFVGLDLAFDQATGAMASFVDSVELTLTLIFIFEFSLRLWAAPSRSRHLRRHWIDAVSLVPPVRALRLLRLLRLVRVFSGVYRVGMNVSGLSRHRGFASLVVTWLGLGAICSIALYAAERDAGSGFRTPLDALWWGVGTLSTVGSDLFPVTVDGRIAAMLLMLLGVFLFSAITATITSFLVGKPPAAAPTGLAGQLREVSELHLANRLTNFEYESAKQRLLAPPQQAKPQ
jgi:voltage-gated potassium channel